MKIKAIFLNRLILIFYFILSLALLLGNSKTSRIIESANKIVFIKFENFVDFYKQTLSLINSASFSLENKNRLQQENFNLKLTLEKYKALGAELEIVKNENYHLKKLLNSVKDIELEKISAEVITTMRSLYSDKAIIKISDPAIIAKGDVVVNYQGLVGKVIDVYENHAKIMLVTDFASRIAVKSSKTGAKAILAGKNSELAELIYLSDNIELELDDILLSSDDSGLNIPNIPVARITEIKNGKIYAKTLVDFDKLDHISVIKTSNLTPLTNPKKYKINPKQLP